ncbi:hypothetical protein HOU02_gp057 [Caulobacter phage CcrBL9]|uniref:Uncharacterized protein n=1 Tax=Caulobacter phage CcrBL9 TaxID=2283270 RepID=A0A385EB02_9CAUD|nr:hypothetical protein HOU02_gp057 [Caulobacter phage CcrBL9]AXQ69081.1 hypothetical protein CcrBL9_gp057c [Caulobacter phage CcrBL9]
MSYDFNAHEELLAIFHADDGTAEDMLKVLRADRHNPRAGATLRVWKTLSELGLAPLVPSLQTKLILYLYVDMKDSFHGAPRL